MIQTSCTTGPELSGLQAIKENGLLMHKHVQELKEFLREVVGLLRARRFFKPSMKGCSKAISDRV